MQCYFTIIYIFNSLLFSYPFYFSSRNVLVVIVNNYNTGSMTLFLLHIKALFIAHLVKRCAVDFGAGSFHTHVVFF